MAVKLNEDKVFLRNIKAKDGLDTIDAWIGEGARPHQGALGCDFTFARGDRADNTSCRSTDRMKEVAEAAAPWQRQVLRAFRFALHCTRQMQHHGDSLLHQFKAYNVDLFGLTFLQLLERYHFQWVEEAGGGTRLGVAFAYLVQAWCSFEWGDMAIAFFRDGRLDVVPRNKLPPISADRVSGQRAVVQRLHHCKRADHE